MVARHRISLAVGIAVLVVGAVWSLVTPPLAVVDEEHHLVYAVSLVDGQLRGEERVFTAEEIGLNRTVTTVRVPRGYADAIGTASCHVFLVATSAGCSPPLPTSRGGTVDAPTTAGTYPPPWYVVVGLPTRVLPPSQGVYAARLVNVLLSALAIGAAAAGLARGSGPGWRWLGLVVALPPMAWQLVGGVNPNGAEIAVALVVWVAGWELLRLPVTRAAIVRWTIGGAALVVMRPLSTLWLLVATVILLVAQGDRQRLATLVRDRRVLTGAGVVVGMVVATGAWLVWRDTLSAFQGVPDPTAVGSTAVTMSLGRTGIRTEQMVGVLGYLDLVLPRAVVWSWLVVTPALLALAVWRGTPRLRWALGLLVVAVVLVPVLAEARSAAEIGYSWQGRYSLPMAVGAPLLAGLAADHAGVRTRGLVLAGSSWLLSLQVLTVLAALRRYETGVTRPLLDVLRDVPGWEPPRVDDGLLLALVVASAVLVIATVGRPSVRPDTSRGSDSVAP